MVNKKLEEKVETATITGAVVHNIRRNIMEKIRVNKGKTEIKEAVGDIVGRKYGNKYILRVAYQWSDSETDEEVATYGDFEARKEVLLLDRELRKEGIHNYYIIGQYHSHTYKKGDNKREAGLSEEDKEGRGDIPFFRELMRISELEESVQIVASIRLREYKRRCKTSEKVYDYRENKIRGIWKIGYRGYDIILNAFILPMKGKPRRIPIRLRNKRKRFSVNLSVGG